MIRFLALCSLLSWAAFLAGCASSGATGDSIPVTPADQSTALNMIRNFLPPLAAASPSEKRVSAATEEAAPVLDYENNVYFTPRKTTIDDQGLRTLLKHAKRLKEDSDLTITLIGHTDHLGSRSYNQAISEERLDAVVGILRSHGVAKRQIRRIALGNEKAGSGPCLSDACRQSLRRVEIVYGEDAH